MEGRDETAEEGGAAWKDAVSRSAGDGLPSTCLRLFVIGIGLRDLVPNIMKVYTYHSVSYSKTL